MSYWILTYLQVKCMTSIEKNPKGRIGNLPISQIKIFHSLNEIFSFLASKSLENVHSNNFQPEWYEPFIVYQFYVIMIFQISKLERLFRYLCPLFEDEAYQGIRNQTCGNAFFFFFSFIVAVVFSHLIFLNYGKCLSVVYFLTVSLLFTQ